MMNGVQAFLDFLPISLTLLIFATPFYWLYRNAVLRRQKPEYYQAVAPVIWKIGLSLAMVSLYCGLALMNDYWNPLIGGVFFAGHAVTFFYMTNHELNCAMTITPSVNAPESLVKTTSRLVSLGMTLSLLSLVAVYTLQAVPVALLTLQVLLYLSSLTAYNLITGYLNLQRIGYVTETPI